MITSWQQGAEGHSHENDALLKGIPSSSATHTAGISHTGMLLTTGSIERIHVRVECSRGRKLTSTGALSRGRKLPDSSYADVIFLSLALVHFQEGRSSKIHHMQMSYSCH
jgi:hypothetical protein